MKHNKQNISITNKVAFTLVELIVVIVILAILGTISYIALQDYSKSSRNSVRLTDIGVMKQSLGIFKVEAGKYPDPNDLVDVTYSGGVLWSQGSFGEIAFTTLTNLSKIPLDPLFDSKYDYSVIHNNGKYQIGSVIEGGLFTLNNSIIFEANAINQRDVTSYISGDYGLYDIKSQNGDSCVNVTAPSMFVGNPSATGSLDLSIDYTFVYDESSNLTQNYVGKLANYSTGATFQIEEVFNSCEINTLDELNLYISKLSLSYQQLLGVQEFEEIIYDFDSTAFRVGLIDDLRANGIKVHNDVVLAAGDTSGGHIYIDTFTGNDSDELISHETDTLGSWTNSGSVVNGSYIISSNSLLKTDNLSGVVFPTPALPITSIDRTIAFDLIDFSGGNIIVYTNYTDSNNYYGIELNSSGYTLIHKVGGADGGVSYPYNVAIAIGNNSKIEFNISSNKIKFKVNNIELENIIDSNATFIGNPAISMNNTNAKIDNFTLIYK